MSTSRDSEPPARESDTERVLVCGSREWGDRNAILSRLTGLPGEHERITIVHGAASRIARDARGLWAEHSADMLADAAARELGFAIECHPADWHVYGKRAGFIRNVEMLDSGVDRVLAFQRNGSRGTQHTIDEARRRGIPVEIIEPSPLTPEASISEVVDGPNA